MPRIYTSQNDPLDFCKYCFPTEDTARKDYGHLGNGPNGRGNCFAWDAEHPNYDDEEYTCDFCGEELTERDN